MVPLQRGHLGSGVVRGSWGDEEAGADRRSELWSSLKQRGKRGICTWTKLSAKQRGDTFTLTVAPVEGSYPGMIRTRAYQVRLPDDWPPASVTVNGVRLGFTAQDEEKPGWRYDGNRLASVITTQRFSVHTPVRITVERAAGSMASRSQLDGVPGSIARLHEAYDTLNAAWPFAWSPNSLIDAWQTGDRISYHPETVHAEMARFPQIYAQAVAQIQELTEKSTVPIDQLMKNRGRDTTKERAEHYKQALPEACTSSAGRW